MKKLFVISILSLSLAATPVSALAASSNAYTNGYNYVIEEDPQYNIPTETLLQQFPITYQTPAETEMSKKIQNRMLNGFYQWNQGFDAWENWGKVLYHPSSIYHVHGVRLTLPEYQKSMNMSLKSMDIQMGNFNNMILSGDWMAIRYDITTINRKTGKSNPGTTMEFAKFGDFGAKGAKVDEGFGGVKGPDYAAMMSFQTDAEKKQQEAFMQEMINTKLPVTNDLRRKYLVKYPTPLLTAQSQAMRDAILQNIDAWNQGYDTWSSNADTFFTAGVQYNLSDENINLSQYKNAVKSLIDSEQIVRINNLLVSEDWAAIHYWSVVTDTAGNKTADDHMSFLHFVENDGALKVDMAWTK